MMGNLTAERLKKAVVADVAIRRSCRLQPAGGAGDKVFPPTYEGGQYALEERIIDGERKACVLLDSVQSQANRMESALLEACRAGKFTLPVIEVDFAKCGLTDIGSVTSLEAPHRIADAILRDSLHNGVKFRESAEGMLLDTATVADATSLLGICPTALLFGMWDSAGPRGGMGTKFQRAIVSELFGVDIVQGARPSSRIDPLQIMLNGGPIYEAKNGGWTLNDKEAVQEKGKAKVIGKEGKPSEINHGNITPTLKGNHGGVTLAYAIQSTVISLAALRRLRFPVKGKSATEIDVVARTVLAALGICAAALSIEQGCDLRSRCLLVPEAGHPARWEFVHGDGSVEEFSVTAANACSILNGAVEAATGLGLPWRTKPLVLTPSDGLAALVRKSRDLAMYSPTEGN